MSALAAVLFSLAVFVALIAQKRGQEGAARSEAKSSLSPFLRVRMRARRAVRGA
jgi:hypothetical protein